MTEREDVFFLSYSRDDAPWVATLKSALEARGIRVWQDDQEIRPGTNWVTGLQEGLQAATSVGIVVSDASMASKWVKQEHTAAQAQAAAIPIIPILLQGTEENLPVFLKTRQSVDFRAQGEAFFQEAVERLCWGITGRKWTGSPSTQPTFAFNRASLFGDRMRVSGDAKRVLAEHCVKSGFWQRDEVVFLESGTIPVYMIDRLYSDPAAGARPRALVTNNVLCCGLAVMDQASTTDASFVVHPLDTPLEVVLIGGRVLTDYAATIPEDLLSDAEPDFERGATLLDSLSMAGVTHVIMMVTCLTKAGGPCARSAPMQRFKKLLLRYVAEHPEARLSILAEADKLAAQRAGGPADKDGQYWPSVLPRTSILAAMSRELSASDASSGLARREMRELSAAGATCTLLGLDGEELSLTAPLRV